MLPRITNIINSSIDLLKDDQAYKATNEPTPLNKPIKAVTIIPNVNMSTP